MQKRFVEAKSKIALVELVVARKAKLTSTLDGVEEKIS